MDGELRLPPYRNMKLDNDARISDLIGRMTLEEKIGQMMQLDARNQNLERLIVDMHVGSILHTSPDNLFLASTIVKTKTRLGIPLIIGDDCIHGYSFWPGGTIFPEQLGMAASWDPSKIEEMARATAQEVSCTGVHWTFSPVLCIARDTRWGRVGETFGEDQTLISEFASAMVSGYQRGARFDEPLGQDAILACAKHFAGYSETQGGRDASEADLSHRKLVSWFLPAFERAAREGCGSFMLGYESIDGTPVTFNHWLLTEVLRGEWQYDGTLITDWDNVGRSVWEQKVKPDYAHAAADAIKAGNDLIMSTPRFYEGAITAVHSGLLDENLIDAAVKRVLTLKFRLGLFENPRLPDENRMKKVIGSAEHQRLNLDLTRESIVLLRNNGALPFKMSDDGRTRRIAVVGALADDPQTQLGDWAGNSGQVDWMPEGQPRAMITTVLDGIRELAPDNWTVTYSSGADVINLVPDPAGDLYPDGQPRSPIAVPAEIDASKLSEAVEAAKAADLVLAVVGDVIELVGESRSTATLELQGGQNAMLEALKAVAGETGKPMIVVLLSSKPQVLPRAAMEADALLWAPSPGMEGGRAIAEIILGRISPSGRLPISFPRHAGQLPIYYNQIRGQHGNSYADLPQDPAFCFGEGLSYTTFRYGNPVIAGVDRSFGIDDTLHVSVEVSNTGSRAGVEVVQVYLSDLVTSVSWADRELKAFRRVELQSNETKTVSFDIAIRDCSIVDEHARRVVESGDFELLVGHSSRRADLKSVTFSVI